MPGFYARQGGSFHAVAAQDNLPSRPQLCHDGRVDLPVIDIAPLCVAGDLPREPDQAQRAVAAALGVACRRDGFFYIAGHGLDPALVTALFDESRRFFALPLAQKQAIASATAARQHLPPVPLAELARHAAGASAQHHRAVRLRGRWSAAHTLYLENRPMNGRPGFVVLTPLVLDDGTAVAVQRGWLPRDPADRTRVQAPLQSKRSP